MPGRRKALSGRLPVVAVLLVPLFLLGQGCEKQRTGKPVGPVGSSAATVESASAPTTASAPVQEGAASSRPSAGTPRQADRPAAPPERTTETGPVEATEMTDASFAEVTGKGVVLVDFWSERCPPCRMQGPIVDSLAKKFAGRATIGKLDVGANRRTAGRFRIMYIPTLIIFKKGKEVKRLVGLQREAVLASDLEEALKGE